jgi:hypothetical protein
VDKHTHKALTAESLARLAVDQAGKPEGETAREKLFVILEKYPESFQPEVLGYLSLLMPELTIDDLVWIEDKMECMLESTHRMAYA